MMTMMKRRRIMLMMIITHPLHYKANGVVAAGS